MKKWHIKGVKTCMEKLLISDTFDDLWLEQAQITMKNTISIDGHFQKKFYTEEELEEQNARSKRFLLWKEMKSFCFGVIKGSRTPYSMKIEFLLPEESYEELLRKSGTRELRPPDLSNCFMRFLFQEQKLYMLSGISLKLFSMDKSVEQEWDSWAEEYLKKNGIDYEEEE